MKEAKWEVFKDKDKQFRFRLVAPNGEKVLQSEGYTRKASALDTVKAIQKYAGAKIIDLAI